MKNAALEWMTFASNDLQAAKKLSDDEHLTGIVLFHCQQTIEKAFKALLSEYTEAVPRIHSVYTLFEKLPAEIQDELHIQIKDLEIIDTIYIDSRYPSDLGLLPSGVPTKKEVVYILELTAAIFNNTNEFLNQ